jgi:inosine-uridine nucleoside N-ribohydrolase
MANPTEPAVPIILDVDTGVDDALALALAVRWSRVELVAVSTVAGNVDIDLATSNTLTVLDWFGATEVPVHRGASRPLARPLNTAVHVHGEDGLGEAGLPPSRRALGPDRGPAAMIRLARARPGELTLVCVGPLTNLAIALNVEPSLPELVAGVVFMGGAYRVAGNTTPAAEFNIYDDPEAATQVFEAASRFRHLTAIGLDVSHQTSLNRADWEASRRATEHTAGLLARIAHRTFEHRRQPAFYLHDPLALAVAVDPSLVVCEQVSVEVVLDGESRGQTCPIGPGPVRVARTVEAARFLRLFRTTVGLPDA